MLTLRPAGPDDLGTLLSVGRRCYVEHYRDIWSSAGLDRYLALSYDRGSMARELEGTRVHYELAWLGEEPVGFAKAVRDRALPSDASQVGLELEKIYLLRTTTGRGFGARMIERVVDLAKELGQPLVWLDVLKSNTGGVRFYERAGFVRVGEVPFATDILDIGMWVMSRPI